MNSKHPLSPEEEQARMLRQMQTIEKWLGRKYILGWIGGVISAVALIRLTFLIG